MAEIAGKDADVEGITAIECGTAHPNSWSIDYSGDALETTDFCVTEHREYIAGLLDWSGSIDFYIDDGAQPPTPGTSHATAKFFLDTGADVGYYGEVIITGVSLDAGVEDVVSGTVDFQGTGSLTYSSSLSTA